VRSEQAEYGDEPPLDPLLGQPRMVSDPRISVAQAAQILGKTRAQVYRLVTLGPPTTKPSTGSGARASATTSTRRLRCCPTTTHPSLSAPSTTSGSD
jgi:hypothetical protein